MRLLQLQLLCRSFSRYFYGKEFLHDIFLDAVNHFLEHFETLLLIFLEGIFLAVAPQSDSLFKMVHIQEMVLPQAIDGLEHDDFFQLS
jgi:hypothetical protein